MKPPEPAKAPPREPRRPSEPPRRVPIPEPEPRDERPRDTRSAGPRHPTRPAPRMEPVPVPVTPPRGSGAREPTRRRVVATTPAPLPRADRDPGPSGLAPFRPENQEEIAVHLTAALATRMKPPPAPPRDLSPSTALWLLATGTAVALLLLALVTPGDYLWAAGAIGAAELLVGYAWIVWLTFRREAKRGLLCAIPPVTAWYLVQRKYGKFRPLWFAATGLVLVGLAAAGGLAQPRTRAWAGAHEPAPPTTPTDLAKKPKLEQIRAYREQRSYDPLVKVLDVLAKTDPTFSEDAKYRSELTAELRSLCGHQHSDVRMAALAAYARWGGDDARELCLSFVRSEIQDERTVALRLLPRWKDAEVARAVASRIGRPGTETTYARDALLEIGGPAAEQATIPLLRSDDQGTRLTAMDVLGKVGGADAVAALTELAASDPTVRDRATQKAQAIQARLGGKK